ncbi:NlpC/P60 family protein [Labedaea rhizosphaerae]|uniref:Cell wall-associated NlpC family hydrolase n=1 Tax=Labedaea rhizosphaerae TaxID=598644 RepID=A0A4R6SGQ9_LABRH|nr:NlpC/P60 family protein [Labedaea rhizosphaerae]TDQ00747.1 cell wall-associated NlpC family hydrolase [Labedaea rhizosphaerae]
MDFAVFGTDQGSGATMARYTAEQIYAFAREAGFSPDQAATMTAVALAESGGNGGARNPRGEDSRGLWQINVRSHPDLAKYDLYDPVQNAKAAYQVSQGGADVSPWTTTHGGVSARYLRYRSDAEAAAAAYGDGSGHGMWSGSAGYGHPTSAGDARGAHTGHPTQATQSTHPSTEDGSAAVNAHTASATAEPTTEAEEYGLALDAGTPDAMAGGSPPASAGDEYGVALTPQAATPKTTTPAPAESTQDVQTMSAQPAAGDNPRRDKFLQVATAQTGDDYVWGAKAGMDDPNPSAFDCSDLVQWSTHQVGVDLPRTAWEQYEFLHKKGYTIPVEQGIHTPGALLFSFSSDPDSGHPAHSHVVISLGNGKTMEAKGSQYGVGSWEANTHRFQYAVVIPGISDGAVTPYTPSAHQQAAGDDFDHQVQNDPSAMDADPVTVSASQQLTGAAPEAYHAPPAEHHADHTDHAADHHADLMASTDVDGDGMDDALAHVSAWPAHDADTHGDDFGVADDHGHHDPAGAH